MAEDRIIKGWKDISKFLGTSERSAIRWMKEMGLPIQRVGTRRGASVFAHESDLRKWLETVGTRLADDSSEPVVVADAPQAVPPEPAPRTQTHRVAWVLAALIIVAGGAWVAWSLSRPPATPKHDLQLQPAVALRVIVPGAKAATLVVSDGKRSTIAFPGRPAIHLDAKIKGDRMTLDVIGPGADGKDVVLFSSELAPGTRISVKRPFAFDLEWPAAEPPSASS